MTHQTYDELLGWALELQLFGIKLGLSSTEALLDRLGNPHQRLRAVHLAGSNGKGSTAAMLANILREAGLKVGFYSSPHLVNFRERYLINGRMPTREKLAPYLARVKEVCDLTEPPTFFEYTTALAFLYFAEQKVDVAVIETGLGGRLDATNIISPAVSLITPISIEHTQYLGETLPEIAFEKAGIIKPKTPVASQPQQPEALAVLTEKARAEGSKLYLQGRDFTISGGPDGLAYKGLRLEYDQLKIGLAGFYQADNAALALAGLELLEESGLPGPDVDAAAVRRGLTGVGWPGRMQVLGRDPLVILDGAHNPAACRTLATAVGRIERRRTIIVTGAMSDKDHRAILEALGPLADELVLTRPAYDRSAEPEELARVAAGLGYRFEIERDLMRAVELGRRKAEKDDLVVITGSLFIVGEVLTGLGLSAFEEDK